MLEIGEQPHHVESGTTSKHPLGEALGRLIRYGFDAGVFFFCTTLTISIMAGSLGAGFITWKMIESGNHLLAVPFALATAAGGWASLVFSHGTVQYLGEHLTFS
ncbi:hypothetical protein HY387_00530 [Candidatus Daviesbacteria bacterium]|nr:hypothetical protein [Candidatus Daviesbacteria bacterium]